MTDSHGPAAHDSIAGETDGHHGPTFKTYMMIFVILCVLTSLSFIFNTAANNGIISHLTSAVLIMMVSICKATLVAMFFMHLKYDWMKLYFLVFPVVILTVMMVIVLLPDTVLGWHQTLDYLEPTGAPHSSTGGH